MATTTLNLHSFKHSTCSSISFQISTKMPHFSCFNPKTTAFLNPIQLNHLGFCFNGKPDLGRSLTVVQATEVVAPTTEDQVASESKTSKKKKKVTYPRRVLDQYQVLQFPIITEAAVKNIAEENTLLFTVDIKADKKMIRDAVTNLFGVKVRKVNTAIRPDGTKKAHIMLTREYNASELAKKIGIFPSSD